MKLSKQQKYAIKENGNILVIACPGAGKTRTLVARANTKLDEIPEHKLLALITYTNAAADEIYSRIEDDEKFFIGTLHSFCLEYILRPFGWIYSWKKPKVINYRDLLYFISKLNSEFKISLNSNDDIKQLNKIKRNLDGSLENNIEDWRANASIEVVANHYFQFLDSIGAIDFNEILYRSYKIISENDFVCEAISNKFYELLIDEFQDINIFQYEILKKINHKNKSSFFMVGDPNQAIMGFAGAVDDVFTKAKCDFTAKLINLTETYRSSCNIVDTYSSVIENHPKIDNKSEYAEFSEEVGIYECSINSCKVNVWNGCSVCDNNVTIIKELIDSLISIGLQEKEIAVLSPWGNDCYKIAKKLGSYYNFVGVNSLPHSISGINDSTFYLMQSLFRFSVESSMRHLRIVRRSVERHLVENNIIDIEDINLFVNNLLVNFLRIDKDVDICTGLQIVTSILDTLFGIEHITINEIVKRINERGCSDWNLDKYGNTISEINGVYNDTIHSAKGLEYTAVILNQINERRIPHYTRNESSPSQKSLINGEKVIYVALSRAKKHLRIVHNSTRSRFVDRLNIVKKIVSSKNIFENSNFPMSID